MSEDTTDIVLVLEDALSLVYDAQSLTLKGLRANPSKDEKRRLKKRLASLKLEQKDIEDLIDAYEESDDVLPPPNPTVVSEIAALTGQVEGHRQANLTAASALEISGKVLDMAIKATA